MTSNILIPYCTPSLKIIRLTFEKQYSSMDLNIYETLAKFNIPSNTIKDLHESIVPRLFIKWKVFTYSIYII